MRSKEFISEKWTKKYKNSINCNNPKGFSQKAHCAGRKKVNEGEVVSLQARKTPLVIAGSPYDWDIYDLRNNKMVASIIGGDRHDSPLYEVRINRNGMTESTKMLPTYVVTAGANNEPPYRVYELEVPSEVDKIEKSPGPGGTTKLKPDTMDVFMHMADQTAKGRYYGYNLILVEEGLDQYEIIEKALGAKIMEIDDAMELGYTDYDPEDSSGYPILYLGNQQNEGYSAGASGGLGLGEEQIPMFTPEEKMVNANDPMSDGWRVYKAQPAGSKDDIDEVSNFLALRQKDDEFKKIFGTTPLYKEGDKIVTKFSDKTPNVKGVVLDFDPKTKKTLIKAEDGETYFVHAQNLSKVNKESLIKKGIQSEADTGVTRWSKDNPPPPELLLNTLIQILMNPNNNKSPQDLISLWNEKYGLKHTLGGLRQYAQNDYKKAELSKALQKAVLAYESSKGK